LSEVRKVRDSVKEYLTSLFTLNKWLRQRGGKLTNPDLATFNTLALDVGAKWDRALLDQPDLRGAFDRTDKESAKVIQAVRNTRTVPDLSELEAARHELENYMRTQI
jgi:hypothetical protein